MDNKVYIVTYDATNEYTYSEDDYGFSDTFGVFSNVDEANKKVQEFINELKTLITSKGLKYHMVDKTLVYDDNRYDNDPHTIEFTIDGVRDCDISGFIFYIREAELDHVETKIENLNCLNWLRTKEGK